jgi:hypothetical protein
MRVVDDRHAVVNVAAAMEYKFSDTYSGYLGFWTDFSPVDLDAVTELMTGQSRLTRQGFPITPEAVDTFYLSIGIARQTKKSLFGFAFIPYYGTGKVVDNIDFVNDVVIGPDGRKETPVINGGYLTVPVERDIERIGFSFMFAFTYFFGGMD